MKRKNNLDEYYKKHEAYIKKMKPQWEHEGLDLRYKREMIGISQRKIGYQIGASPSLISRFELGRPVSRRKLLKRAYQTAIELFVIKQQEYLLRINL